MLPKVCIFQNLFVKEWLTNIYVSNIQTERVQLQTVQYQLMFTKM